MTDEMIGSIIIASLGTLLLATIIYVFIKFK